MAQKLALSADDIQQIGEALFGANWRADMARALGVPRQSIGYYLKAGGANRTQATAIIGLIARRVVNDMAAAKIYNDQSDTRRAALVSLLDRFDSADRGDDVPMADST